MIMSVMMYDRCWKTRSGTGSWERCRRRLWPRSCARSTRVCLFSTLTIPKALDILFLAHKNVNGATVLFSSSDYNQLSSMNVSNITVSVIIMLQLAAFAQKPGCGKPCNPTSTKVMVRYVTGIRDHVVQVVELKFNCFFLMPVVDTFPTRLREELEAAYMDDLDEVSNI